MRVTVAGAIAALTVAAAAAQAPQPPVVFRTDADLVEVDVVVRDKSGAFVADLSVDDFVIEENGVPQPIQQFYARRGGSGGASVPAVGGTPGAPAAAPLRRVFVVVFDDAHLTPGGFKRTQAAAQLLFSRHFRDGDLGGVVTRGRMSGDRLTTDREELLASVRDARPDTSKNFRLALEREFPRLSEIEAVRIVFNNDRTVMEEAIRRLCADDPDLCRRFDPEAQVRSKALQLAETVRAESSRTIQMLRAVTGGLVEVPGRKTIVLMSEGFVAEDAWPLVQDAVSLAARANARLYTLDARGLDRGLASVIDMKPAEHDSSARLLEQMDFGADSMNSLAVDTGGFAVRNTNTFDKAVQRIGDDVDNYYVLGMRPAARDGKFHGITVKVNRPQLSVRARRGYIASPAAVTSEARPPAPAAAAATAERTSPLAGEPIVDPAAVAGAPAAASAIDPHAGEATVVSGGSTAGGIRVRPDADAHARTLGSTAADADPDATAGWDAYQRGDVETARSKLAAAAARPSANTWVHYTLGMSSYALRDYREAAAAWERVRAAAPEFEPVYFDLVDAYLQMHEHDHATRVARIGMERWPRDPELLNALGVVQTVRGSLDDAVRSFQTAIAIAPSDATAYFNLGKAMELRYARSRRYVQQLRQWVSNESDRRMAIDNYQRYLDLAGAYADAARAGIERLKWMPSKH